jgi:hypothetical protein
MRLLLLFPAACPCRPALLRCSFGVVWGPFRVVRATSGSRFWVAEAWGPFLRGVSRSRRQVLPGKEVMLSSRQVPALRVASLRNYVRF